MENKVIFLFGLPGVGKSYLGNLIQEKYGYFHYEADDDLTDEIKETIRKNQLFTEDMRDRFYEIVCSKILELQGEHKKIVVSQALFKNKHRKFFKSRINELILVWVQADPKTIFTRLKNRESSVSLEYANLIKNSFEVPDFEIKYINNDENILDQELKKIV